MNVAGPAVADTLWEMLGSSRARLAPDVRFAARTVRGRDECVVRNEASGAHVRIDPTLARLLRCLDGRRTVAECLASVTGDVGKGGARDAAALERLAAAVATLERAGIVSSGLPGEGERTWRGHREAVRADRRRFRDPLSVRVPLIDPDAALDRVMPALRRVPVRIAWAFVASVLVAALWTCVTRAPELADAFAALAGTPTRWWVVAVTWPALKCLHEAAHAVAVRACGGRVHEAGLALLVLMPVPYVDASDASLFSSRRARALVGAAGMLAEFGAAALALLLWSALEPGAWRDLAFAVVVAGSVSTVLFNANPLLRFDGYHVLVDVLGMPNLAARASAWWCALARHRLFGLQASPSAPGPEASRFERRVLALYGALAWVWRHVVVFGIALWLMGTVPVAGVALAGFALWPLLVRPALRLGRWLVTSPELAPVRARAALAVVAAVALPALVVLLLPLPSSTRVEGVVRSAAPAELTVPEAGDLVRGAGLVGGPDERAGRSVTAGTLLARIDAPALGREHERALARVDELDARRAAAWREDPVEARALAAELVVVRTRTAELGRRLASLDIRAPHDGRFVPAPDADVPGAHLPRGLTLGHLVDDGPFTVRAAVRERDVGRLDAGVRAVRVRLAEAPGDVLRATLPRSTPAADRTLPSASLAGSGGMAVASVDDRLETVEPVFHIEIGLPASTRVAGLGGRAYVTLAHDPESLARRWTRSFRQLFLDRLGP